MYNQKTYAMQGADLVAEEGEVAALSVRPPEDLVLRVDPAPPVSQPHHCLMHNFRPQFKSES